MAIPTVHPQVKALFVVLVWAIFSLGYFARFPLPGFVSVTYNLLFTMLITGAAWGYGRRLAPDSFILATTAGFGILSLLMVLGGVLGTWTRLGATMFLLPGLMQAWILREELVEEAQRVPNHLRDIPKLPFLFIAVGMSLSLLAALAPITFYDSLVYHLALPSAYIQAGRWVGMQELIYSAFPQTLEMLWTLGMLLVGDLLANLIGWVVASLGLLAVYSFGRHFLGLRAAAWATALLAAMPAYILLTSGGYVDVGLAVFSFTSFFAIWLWVENRRAASGDKKSHLLVLAGFLAGCALGCKYTGAIPLAISALFLLKETFSSGFKSMAAIQVRYAGTALLVFSPWLIKNLYFVGNPVFPFFCTWSLTGKNPWVESAAAGYFRGLAEYTPRSGFDLLKLVWDVAVNGFSFGGGMDVLGDMGWAPFFVLLPVLWLARKKPFTLYALLIYILCFFIPWGMSRPVLRFLMPVTPFMALAAGYAIDQGILTKGPAFRVLSLFFIGALLLSGFRAFFDFTDYLSLYRVPLGIETRSDFLARKLNYFSAASFVNTLPPDSLTYVIGDQRGYYYNRSVIVTPVFNTNPLTGWANESSSGQDLIARLKNKGITHLLINNPGMTRLDKAYHLFPFSEKGKSNWNELRSQLAKSVYRDPHCDVLALP